MENTKGYWRGGKSLVAVVQELVLGVVIMFHEVVVTIVVVRAGDRAAAAVSVDRERDVPRPRPRATAAARRWRFPGACGARVTSKRRRAQPRRVPR